MERSQSRLSILVVDDCKDACETMGLVIASKFLDVTVYIACNGRLGLDLFKEHMPDIVITDINMPEMDGIQMAAEIKSVRKDAHIIVLTGNSDEELLDKFSKIGYEDFLIKPIEFNRLFAAIGKCIAELAVLSHSKETSGNLLTQVA